MTSRRILTSLPRLFLLQRSQGATSWSIRKDLIRAGVAILAAEQLYLVRLFQSFLSLVSLQKRSSLRGKAWQRTRGSQVQVGCELRMLHYSNSDQRCMHCRP